MMNPIMAVFALLIYGVIIGVVVAGGSLATLKCLDRISDKIKK